MLYAKVFGSIVINLGMNADENSEKKNELQWYVG